MFDIAVCGKMKLRLKFHPSLTKKKKKNWLNDNKGNRSFTLFRLFLGSHSLSVVALKLSSSVASFVENHQIKVCKFFQ